MILQRALLAVVLVLLCVSVIARSESPNPAGQFVIEVGAFRTRTSAEDFLSELKKKGLEPRLGMIELPDQGERICVLVGSFSTTKAASRYGRQLVTRKTIKRFAIRPTNQIKSFTRSRRIKAVKEKQPTVRQEAKSNSASVRSEKVKFESTSSRSRAKSEPSAAESNDEKELSLTDSDETVSADDITYKLPLADLGFTTKLRLSGAAAEQTLSIPIHSGQRPATLTAQLQIAPNVKSGYLMIANQELTLMIIPLPKTDTPISVSLARAEVKQEHLTLVIRSIMNPGDDTCAPHKLQWMELSDFTVTCMGKAHPPTTVAEFWPPDITDLHLYISPDPNMAEANAALTLTVFAARVAVGHPLRVTVQALDPGAPWPTVPSQPFSRTVVVRHDAVAEMRLVTPPGGKWPLLLVTGPPDKLPMTVEQLVGSARPLLLAGRGDVTVIQEGRPKEITQKTLGELGYAQIQMQGAGQMEAHMLFAQSDFGGPVSDVALRLAGTYSPIPEGGGAHIAVLLNGGLVYAQPLGQEGKFDFYAPFPDSLLRRDNTLTARVSYTPPGGNCRLGVHEIIIRIDGGSYLQVQHGQKLPEGFERFPQVLLPEFQVSFDRLTPEALHSTAQLVTALQRLSRLPLRPKVVSWEEALKSKQPLLAVALDPTQTETLNPPLGAAPFRILDNEGHQLLRLEVDARFSVLQAFTHQGRDVALLTQRDWVRGLGALTQALNQESGWYNLNGDVWLMPTDQTPYALRLRDSGLRVEPLQSTPIIWWQRFRPVLFLLAFAIVVFFLFWIYPRVVRKRPVGAKAG